MILMVDLFQKKSEKSASISPPSSATSEFTNAQKEDLRELRAEIQDFQELLDDIDNGDTTLALCKDYVEKTKVDINAILDRFATISQDNSHREDLRRIRDVWEQMESNPIIMNPGDFPADQQLHYMNMLKKRIRKIVYLISYLTIPERLNEWLKGARPGYYIPFHVVFEDELPTKEDRDKLIERLTYAPRALRGGLINSGTGLIYRYSMNVWRRLLSVIWLLAIFVLATFVIYHIGDLSMKDSSLPVFGWKIPLPYIENWPIKADLQATVLLGWIAILLGILTHAAVGSAKRAQGEGLPPIYAISDLSRYIDARFGLLVRKLLLALVGLFGLMFSSDSVTPLNAFLVGYSLDSVVELFGTSLEQKSASQVTTLRKQLDVTEEK